MNVRGARQSPESSLGFGDLTEASLTAGRPARTPDAHAGSSAELAVDRDPRTVWEAPEGSRLHIDMGTDKVIDRVAVETPRLFSEQTSTKLAIKVQASRDGHSFSPVTTLRPGPWGWVDVPVTPVKARYLQLTATGSDDGTVRIASVLGSEEEGPRMTEPAAVLQEENARQILGRNLRQWRQDHGLLLKQMAPGIGVSESTLNAWETGFRFPSTDHLPALAQFFGVPICFLLRSQPGTCLDGDPPACEGQCAGPHGLESVVTHNGSGATR